MSDTMEFNQKEYNREYVKQQRIINLIVQARVAHKVCIDCGAALKVNPGYLESGKPRHVTAGYCQRMICGRVSTRIMYTKVEWEAAMEKQATLKRISK